jgi:hypothetical protein
MTVNICVHRRASGKVYNKVMNTKRTPWTKGVVVDLKDWEKVFAPQIDQLLIMLEKQPKLFTHKDKLEAYDTLQKLLAFDPVFFKSQDVDGDTPTGNSTLSNFNETWWKELRARFEKLEKLHRFD